MAIITKASFPRMLMPTRKNCILVKGKHPHVRRYNREVKGGMTEWEAVYNSGFEVTYTPLFPDPIPPKAVDD